MIEVGEVWAAAGKGYCRRCLGRWAKKKETFWSWANRLRTFQNLYLDAYAHWQICGLRKSGTCVPKNVDAFPKPSYLDEVVWSLLELRYQLFPTLKSDLLPLIRQPTLTDREVYIFVFCMHVYTYTYIYIQWNTTQPKMKFLLLSTTWMNIEGIMLSEMLGEDKYYMILLYVESRK